MGNLKPTVLEYAVMSNRSQLPPRMVSLPFDVLMLILDAVQRSSKPKKTLGSCALTCRDMQKPAQARMYASVYLSRYQEFQWFGRTLLGNPELAAMVKKLKLDVGKVYIQVSDFPEEDLPWSPQAIQGMVNLQKLSLRGWKWIILDHRGSRTSPGLENFIGMFAAACSQLGWLRLRDLEFCEYTGFVRCITSFPSTLKTLELNAVTWKKGGQLSGSDSISQATCVGLCSLEVSAFLYWS